MVYGEPDKMMFTKVILALDMLEELSDYLALAKYISAM